MEITNTINLPSFVRRTKNTEAIKSYIRLLGCELSRTGRSRNWQLTASIRQLHAIVTYIEDENEASWLWLVKILQKEFKHLSHDRLVTLASRLEGLTIAALMAQTDCTLAQARKVLDEIEDLD